MYEAYYGLTEKPFNLTPDPRFLYLSPKHKEAFAHLMYGIKNRSGFVMVSGEIGTGKTTICRSLLKQLDSDTEVAFIFNPYLSPEELLKKINHDFGMESSADSVRELIDELNEYLLAKAADGKNCVLIIDEAQNLETEILEQIRLLSNLETETEKLLQIILIGQPELAEKLELYEMRQLNQRITARYHLEALNEEESLHYIAFRLRVAGGGDKIRFNRKAIKLVYKISQGTPRVINALCDRALLIGYTKELTEITAKVIRQAAEEIQGDAHVEVKQLNTGRILRTGGVLSLAAAGVMAFLLVTSEQDLSWEQVEGRLRGQRAAEMSVLDVSDNDASEVSLVSEAPDVLNEDEIGGPDEVGTASSGIAEMDAEESSKAVAEAVVSEIAVASLSEPATPLLDVLTAQNGALSGVLRAWNMAELQPLPQRASRRNIALFGESNGMSVIPLRVTLTELSRINYPSLIEVNFGEGMYWCALLGLGADEARVTGADGKDVQVERGALERAYQGTSILFWLDSESDAQPLRANTRNDDVTELQSNLLKLGLTDREPTGRYGGATIETITQIQRTTGIIADGIYGEQTRMVLSAWLGGDDQPRLASEAFPEHVHRSVTGSKGMVIALPMEEEIVSSPVNVESLDVSAQDVAVENNQESREVQPVDGVDSDLLNALSERSRFALPVELYDGEDERYTPLLTPKNSKPLDSVTPSSGSAVPLQPSASNSERDSVTP